MGVGHRRFGQRLSCDGTGSTVLINTRRRFAACGNLPSTFVRVAGNIPRRSGFALSERKWTVNSQKNDTSSTRPEIGPRPVDNQVGAQ